MSILYKNGLIESGSNPHDAKSSSVSEALSEDALNTSHINRSMCQGYQDEEQLVKKLEQCFIRYESMPSEDAQSDEESYPRLFVQ